MKAARKDQQRNVEIFLILGIPLLFAAYGLAAMAPPHGRAREHLPGLMPARRSPSPIHSAANEQETMSRDKLIIVGVVVLGVLGILVYKQVEERRRRWVNRTAVATTDLPTINASDDIDKISITNGDKSEVVLEKVPDPKGACGRRWRGDDVGAHQSGEGRRQPADRQRSGREPQGAEGRFARQPEARRRRPEGQAARPRARRARRRVEGQRQEGRRALRQERRRRPARGRDRQAGRGVGGEGLLVVPLREGVEGLPQQRDPPLRRRERHAGQRSRTPTARSRSRRASARTARTAGQGP